MITARTLAPALVALALVAGCVADFSDRPFVDAGAADAALGCGNGFIEPGEACDGSDLGGLTCQSAVNAEFGVLGCTGACQLDPTGCHNCGNGLVDGGEGCDVGNAAKGTGCSDTCQVEHGFDCTGEPSVCVTTCGDGLVGGDEACDDRNLAPGDGCDGSCRVELGWACSGEPSVCAETCGNGVLDPPAEGCDDGGLAPGDGCSPGCQVEAGWTCTGDPSTCTPVCGDGLVMPGEPCDDGGQASGDGCSPGCQVEAGWTCAGSPSACVPVCGDGLVLPGEACDDGEQIEGDGCSGACAVEPYFQCSGAPSICTCVVYVNLSAVAGPRDGRSWATAYASVQEGIGTAGNLGACDVWVAAGTYHIFQSSPANRVTLASSVSLLGGFAGTETHRDQRDPAAHVTVLDGEHATLVGQRVRTVVEAMGVTGALIDGFTITHGEGTGNGGGLSLDGGDLVVHRCRFLENTASSGAGLYARNATLTLTDSVLELNAADGDGGGASLSNVQATISGCRFEANEAGEDGGGLNAVSGQLTVTRSRFLRNGSFRLGGGLRVENGAPRLESLLLVENAILGSGTGGGGMSFHLTTPATVVGCTFHGNQAPSISGHALRASQGSVSVGGSIFSPQSASHLYEYMGGDITLFASDLWGGACADCISVDPRFLDPVGGDFRLAAGSPCIDSGDSAGSPAQDIDGNPRTDDPATIDSCDGGPPCPDMGAFEFLP